MATSMTCTWIAILATSLLLSSTPAVALFADGIISTRDSTITVSFNSK